MRAEYRGFTDTSATDYNPYLVFSSLECSFSLITKFAVHLSLGVHRRRMDPSTNGSALNGRVEDALNLSRPAATAFEKV